MQLTTDCSKRNNRNRDNIDSNRTTIDAFSVRSVRIEKLYPNMQLYCACVSVCVRERPRETGWERDNVCLVDSWKMVFSVMGGQRRVYLFVLRILKDSIVFYQARGSWIWTPETRTPVFNCCCSPSSNVNWKTDAVVCDCPDGNQRSAINSGMEGSLILTWTGLLHCSYNTTSSAKSFNVWFPNFPFEYF